MGLAEFAVHTLQVGAHDVQEVPTSFGQVLELFEQLLNGVERRQVPLGCMFGHGRTFLYRDLGIGRSASALDRTRPKPVTAAQQLCSSGRCGRKISWYSSPPLVHGVS